MRDAARVEVPATLRRAIEQAFGSQGRAWCERLPGLVADLMSGWELTCTAEAPRSGFGGVAVPVTRTDGIAAILKVFDARSRAIGEWAPVARRQHSGCGYWLACGRSLKIRTPRYLFIHACLCG